MDLRLRYYPHERQIRSVNDVPGVLGVSRLGFDIDTIPEHFRTGVVRTSFIISPRFNADGSQHGPVVADIERSRDLLQDATEVSPDQAADACHGDLETLRAVYSMAAQTCLLVVERGVTEANPTYAREGIDFWTAVAEAITRALA